MPSLKDNMDGYRGQFKMQCVFILWAYYLVKMNGLLPHLHSLKIGLSFTEASSEARIQFCIAFGYGLSLHISNLSHILILSSHHSNNKQTFLKIEKCVSSSFVSIPFTTSLLLGQ